MYTWEPTLNSTCNKVQNKYKAHKIWHKTEGAVTPDRCCSRKCAALRVHVVVMSRGYSACSRLSAWQSTCFFSWEMASETIAPVLLCKMRCIFSFDVMTCLFVPSEKYSFPPFPLLPILPCWGPLYLYALPSRLMSHHWWQIVFDFLSH